MSAVQVLPVLLVDYVVACECAPGLLMTPQGTHCLLAGADVGHSVLPHPCCTALLTYCTTLLLYCTVLRCSTGHGQKRPSNGSSGQASKHHAATGADGHPTRAGSGSKHGSRDGSSRASGGGASKAGGGKPAASKIRLRGQGGKPAAAAAARGAAAASNSRGSGGGSSTRGGQQVQQQQSSAQQRPRRSSSTGGGKEPQDIQQQQQPAAPLTRQQRKQQKEAEMLLLDIADIDIPDDILSLGDDPLFVGNMAGSAGGCAEVASVGSWGHNYCLGAS